MPSDPFDELERVFDVMSGQMGSGGRVAVDVADEGDAFVAVADLPGFSREEIDVKLADGTTLHLNATRETERERTDPDRWVQRERHERSVSRTITLPERVDEAGCEASYENGVLTVRLPKRAVDSDEGTDIPVS
ncbi:MAG: Hsp20/alpha crystallin family protein [Haloarculaceae archaeon]